MRRTRWATLPMVRRMVEGLSVASILASAASAATGGGAMASAAAHHTAIVRPLVPPRPVAQYQETPDPNRATRGGPVAVSDRVGAKYDLVREGETGYIFPAGDVSALASVFRDFFPDREKRKRMGECAIKRMETWSPREYVNALVQAVDQAARSRKRRA